MHFLQAQEEEEEDICTDGGKEILVGFFTALRFRRRIGKNNGEAPRVIVYGNILTTQPF